MKPIDDNSVAKTASLGAIAQLIENKKLSLFCKVKADVVLVVTKRQNGLVGNAHGRFEGYAYLDYEDAVTCLQEGSVEISKAKLSTAGFLSWNETPIFSEPLPLPPIVAWEAHPKPNETQLLSALFEPKLVKGLTNQLEKSIENISAIDKQSEVGQVIKQTLKSFRGRGVGTKSKIEFGTIKVNFLDLIIDDQRLKQLINGAQLEQSDSDEAKRVAIKAKLRQAGINPTRLALLLFKILNNANKGSAKVVWNLIESDLYSAEQSFDVADVVVRMSDNELVWTDEKGSEHTAKFKTVENLLTKLRKVI